MVFPPNAAFRSLANIRCMMLNLVLPPCVRREGVTEAAGKLQAEGLPELLLRNLEHPRWDQVATRCLSCANCTLVCPTCFCSTVEDITVAMLKKGPVRINLATPNKRQIMFYEQVHDQKSFPPPSFPAPLPKTARFVKSGRIEFYKDEDVFIETGETLPRHKDPFKDTENRKAGETGGYKLALITRNSLYRVHSTHSNNISLLELQDLKPKK